MTSHLQVRKSTFELHHQFYRIASEQIIQILKFLSWFSAQAKHCFKLEQCP